ncbi:MAG: cysteine--tRNA ligase [Chloroflexi bacterium]|nr:cysteine--tRNA ligase [Chloroflexota bacterium]
MVKVFNTISGQKEEFTPLGPSVTMYVCGVTPYDAMHVGHAMSYISFDAIRRYLEFRGHRVKHVQNFTDVDDKIIARARERGLSPQELAETYILQYYADTAALNIRPAHLYPRATQEIPQIIHIVSQLISQGYAYAVAGDVYFRVSRFPRYGRLSKRRQEDMEAGARVEVSEAKENPSDFALWKASKAGEPAWLSPWGDGRPGWHIECTAMALHYLGETVDIHGGGQDLVFPHHENEIAQSEAFTGKEPFVRYWIHNGLLLMDEEKMSKSLGNLVTVKEVLSRHSADALRLLVLSSHYRSPLRYTEAALAGMERGVERLRQAAVSGPAQGEILEEYQEQFMAAMDDDFNTPQAVAVLFDLAREINRGQEAGAPVVKAKATLRRLAGVLGFTLEETSLAAPLVEPLIQLLVQVRGELRKARQWALSDTIRSQLEELDIALEDTSQGTLWRRRAAKEQNEPPD